MRVSRRGHIVEAGHDWSLGELEGIIVFSGVDVDGFVGLMMERWGSWLRADWDWI